MSNFLTKLKARVLPVMAVFAVLTAFNTTATAQCTIEFTGSPCVDNIMNFEVTGLPAGSSSYLWDFAGSISNNPKPEHEFKTAGQKAINVTVKDANGNTLCTATRTIKINESPIVDFELISPDSQCFRGNKFCFKNKSTPGEPGSKIIETTWNTEDGGFRLSSAALGADPLEDWCHSVVDDNGGTFNLLMRVVDDNGCITELTFSDAFTVRGNLGLDFFTDAPVNCGSTVATFTNNSRIAFSDVKTWTWDFGDNTKSVDQDWNGLQHTYTGNGVFDATLIVTSIYDCTDTFEFKAAAENVRADIDFTNVTNYGSDSTCMSENEIQFMQTPIVSNRPVSLLWNFGDPPTGPQNIDDENWSTSHRFSATKPFVVTLNVKVGSVCDTTHVDTVWVFGPGATIETIGAGPPAIIADAEKYQCKITDTIRFVNNSSFFNNDPDSFDWKDEVDPTSALMDLINPPGDSNDYHVFRMWTFGDNSAPKCTTDSRLHLHPAGIMGKNVFTDSLDYLKYDCNGNVVGYDTAAWDAQKQKLEDWFAPGANFATLPVPDKKNCNFSLDELPVHWYTPWEDVRDSMWRCNRPMTFTQFNKVTRTCSQLTIDTTDAANWETEFWKQVPQCFNVTLYLNDTVHPFKCESSSVVSLPLMPPDASRLKWEGRLCTGNDNPNNGVHFKLEDTKPGCGQSQVWVDFDTLAPGENWVGPNAGLLTPPLSSPMPWMKPPAPSWPTEFVKKYGINDVFDKKTGWVSVGLIIGNGHPVATPECRDTFYYDSLFRIIPINATYNIVNDTFFPLQPDEMHFCKGETVQTILNFPYQDSISSLTWNWNDGYRTQELRVRYKTSPTNPNELWNYIVEREIDPNGNLSDIDTIGTRRIITWDTVADVSLAETQLEAAFSSIGLYMRDIDPADIPLYFNDGTPGGPGCIDTTGYGSLIRYGIRPDSSVVTHFRDTMIGAFDTVFVQQLLIPDGLGGFDTIPAGYQPIARHQYNTAGQYIQSLTLRNTLGCQDQRGYIVLIGFHGDISADNIPVCVGQKVSFSQFVRYFSFNPIIDGLYDPVKYWDNPARALAGKETMKWDFAKRDDDPNNPPTIFGEFGPGQEHTYTDSGAYIVRVALKDSNDCRDTVTTKVYVTKLDAFFGFNDLTPPGGCVNIIQFFDSSILYDPCLNPNELGAPCDQIDSFWWNFGDDASGVANTSRLQNPGHNYERFGTFEVTLVVQTRLGCRDTFKRNVTFEGPNPTFEHTTLQICEGESVTLFNKSNDPDTSAKWVWNWGDNSFNSSAYSDFAAGDTQTHVYSNPGFYCITQSETQTFRLPSGDPYQCKIVYPYGDSICVTVISRKPSDFTASDDTVCPGDVITFTDESDSVYTEWNWDFGDGTTGSGEIVTHSYNSSGTYQVVLCPEYQDTTPFTPECPTCDTMTIFVEDIKADFEIDSLNKPHFRFTNTSSNAVQYNWTFLNADTIPGTQNLSVWPTAGGVVSTEENPCATAGAPIGDVPCTGKGMNFINYQGEFYVCLEATNANGCSDTICKLISQDFFSLIRPYNVFTPGNNDGKNDVFDIEIEGEEVYDLVIYNRWGVKVFESTDKEYDWNGQVMNTGADCPEGTYFWTLRYKLGGRDENEISGTVTLIRD